MTFKDGMSAVDEFVRYAELPGDMCVQIVLIVIVSEFRSIGLPIFLHFFLFVVQLEAS